MSLSTQARKALDAAIKSYAAAGAPVAILGVITAARGLYHGDFADADAASYLQQCGIADRNICDFCSSISDPETVVFESRVELVPEIPGAYIPRLESDEGWAACAACAEFIDANNRGGL